MEKKTVAQEIRELGDGLTKIHEGDMDDLGLKGHGSELDRDEPEFDPTTSVLKWVITNE